MSSVGERSPQHRLGWKDSRIRVMGVVCLIIVIHSIADSILPRLFNVFLANLAIDLILIAFAFWFSSSLLNAHRNVRLELDQAVQSKDRMYQQTRALLEQLGQSLSNIERHNRQLLELNAFIQRIHACEDEHEITRELEKSLPGILQCTSLVLYCPTPEGEFRRTVRWPAGSSFEVTLRRDRCDALRKMSRIEGEYSPCPGCNLPDPSSVACVPLRFCKRTTGLLRLTFGKERNALFQGSAESVVLRMASDQLSLAFLRAVERKDLGDKVMKDGLTGAYNRRYMEEALLREITRSLRTKSALSVLMIDLDHFKQLNDSLGHAVGDRVLKELAKTLIDNVRPSDIVCRYGGEEFLIALPDTSSPAAKSRADELRRKIHEISKLVRHHRVISASIGIATVPEHASDLKTLLQVADDALYDAKHMGRDRAVLAVSHRSNLITMPQSDTLFPRSSTESPNF